MKMTEKKYPCHSAVMMTLITPVRSSGRLERSPGLPLPVAGPQPSHSVEAVRMDKKLLSIVCHSMNHLFDGSYTV